MQRLKNVAPPFDVDLLIYDARVECYYFARRELVEGEDRFTISDAYPSKKITRSIEQKAFEFSELKRSFGGGTLYWKMLFKPC